MFPGDAAVVPYIASLPKPTLRHGQMCVSYCLFERLNYILFYYGMVTQHLKILKCSAVPVHLSLNHNRQEEER